MGRSLKLFQKTYFKHITKLAQLLVLMILYMYIKI